jgi:hypothetical protein
MEAFQSIKSVTLAGVVLMGTISALGARDALCMRPDALSSSTLPGSDVFIQSLYAHRHFAQPEADNRGFFGRKHDDEDDDGKKASDRKSEPSALSWELGYAFSYPTLPATAKADLLSHSFALGLGWEAMPSFEMEANVTGDTIPSETYKHGRINVRFEYFRSLQSSGDGRNPASADASDDETDARTYYRTHSDGARAAESGPYLGRPQRKGSSAGLPPFPNFKAAALLEFDKHQNTALETLNQSAIGADLTLSLNPSLSFHASGLFYGYSESVKTFVAALPVTVGQSLVLPSASVAAIAPQFLAFPDFVFEEGASYDIDDNWSVQLDFNQVNYVQADQGMSLGFAPMVLRRFSGNWMLGLGGDLIVANGATSPVGLINLSYLF